MFLDSFVTQLHSEIQEGLEYYDPENLVFPKIKVRICAGEPLVARDILLILKWKLGRVTEKNLDTVSSEHLNEINNAVLKANSPDQIEQIDALTNLILVPGIGLAVASAILTVCYPEKYSVIDWRVLEMLGLYPTRLKNKLIVRGHQRHYDALDWTTEEYIKEFLPALKSLLNEKITLRDLDRALWGLSVRNGQRDLANGD